MTINSDQITGFALGVGSAAVAFYLYKRNQQRVDDWLRQQGVSVPTATAKDAGTMSLEELVREKERLEDLIAEREMGVKEQGVAEPGAAT